MRNQWGPDMDHTYIPQDIAVLCDRIGGDENRSGKTFQADFIVNYVYI